MMKNIDSEKIVIDANIPKLDPRLMSAIDFVRRGGVLCDVGTDHAYIPIYAVNSGLCRLAVASDINKGPLERARLNAEKCGAADKIAFYLCDGLDGVEPEKNNITDIVICGMGGELIARIIDASDYAKTVGVRLILQPMTKAYELRKYLTEAGFNIIDEKLSESVGKIYVCICAEYSGNSAGGEYSGAELLLGRCNINRGGDLLKRLAQRELTVINKRIAGITAAVFTAAVFTAAGPTADLRGCDREKLLRDEIEKVILNNEGGENGEN